MAGYIKYAVINSDGTIAHTGEHSNLILNGGLDMLATTQINNAFLYCTVGTGSSTPIITQTTLDTEKARTAAIFSDGTETYNGTLAGTVGSQYILKRTWEFPIGALNSVTYGALTEIGFAPASTGSLFSRALFKDTGGNAIGITVLSTQSLRVTYMLTVNTLSLTTSTTTVNITGIGNVNCSIWLNTAQWAGNAYDTVLLGAGNPSSSALFRSEAYLLYGSLCSINIISLAGASVTPLSGYPSSNGGSMDPSCVPTMMVNGTVAGAIVSTYITNSFSKTYSYTFGTSSANGTLSAFTLGMNQSSGRTSPIMGSFNPPIVKTNVYSLSLSFTKTWGRI